MLGLAVIGAVGLAPASGYAASLLTQFQGGSLASEQGLGNGFIPPDMGGAVGNGQVMQIINGQVSFYDTAGSLLAAPVKQSTFWANAGLSAGAGDSRVIFDTTSSRWIVSGFTGEATNNNLLIAISNGASLTSGFSGVHFPSAAGVFADFPTLGVNNAAVTIGTNNFGSTGNFVGNSLYSIPKSNLLAVTPSTTNMTRFDNTVQVGNNSPVAVTGMSGSGTDTTVLSVNYGANGLKVSTIANANGAGATLSGPTTVSGISGTLVTGGAQPGGATYETGDNRIGATSYQAGNRIYFANAVFSGITNAIQWGILDATTHNLIASGLISDLSLGFSYPSISANADGTFVIGFNGSSSSQAIADYYVVCSVNSATCGAPIQVYSSPGSATNYQVLDSNSRNRWGDYSVTTVDPLDPNNFWLFQQYAVSNTSWATVISEIGTAVPEPGTLGLFGLGMAALLVAQRRKAGVVRQGRGDQ